MAVTDNTITLVTLLKLEAPGGDVRLCSGGFVDYESERYTAEDSTYGTVINWGDVENGFGDLSEGGTLTFAPNPDVARANWYRSDLEDARIRIWQGEVGADAKTVTGARELNDMLIDTVGIERVRGAEYLQIDLIARSEKLFLRNEGNVCSTRFHDQQFSGEIGFNNCTGVPGVLAWGVGGVQASAGSGGGAGSGTSPFNNNVDFQ